MGKRIWIVNYYTGTPLSVSNPRYIELAKYFMSAGYDVVTFNSSQSAKTQDEQTKEGCRFLRREYDGMKFVHINAPAYKGNGIKRMLSIFSFAWSLFVHRKEFPKPEVILHNIHTPFDYPVIWAAKKMKVKYVAEAWDLWPEDFVTFGLVSRSNPLLKLFYSVEKRLYYHADQLVFTFEGIYDYLGRKGWTKETGGKIDVSKVHYINNGINLEKFDKDKEAFPKADADINDRELVKVVYLGSIRLANNVKALIDAADMLKQDRRYRFFIYGNGVDRPMLEQYVADNHIDNVVFKDKWMPYSECAWVVSQADINIMNYEKGFGHMGVSSGKMFQYLAAGKPIICNIDIAYDDVITDNNLGVARDLTGPAEFAAEIERIAGLPDEEYKAMCARVRQVAEKFDYKVLAARELNVLES